MKRSIFIGSLLAVLLFWRPTVSTWGAIWIERWAIFGAVFGSYLLMRIKFRLRFMWLIPAYILIMTLFNSTQPPIPGAMLAQWDQLWVWILFLGFVYTKQDWSCLLKMAAWAQLLGIACSKHPTLEVWGLDNPSMAAIFVVLASELNPLACIPVLLLTQRHTALVAFLVAMAFKYRRILFFWPVPAFCFGGIAAFTIKYWPVISTYNIPDNGRFGLWFCYFRVWYHSGWEAMLLGAGAGTSRFWIDRLATYGYLGTHGLHSQFAHNDWLQCLIEMGIVGSVLIILCLSELWLKAKESERILLLAFGVSCLTDFPVHYPVIVLALWSWISRVNRPGYYEEIN